LDFAIAITWTELFGMAEIWAMRAWPTRPAPGVNDDGSDGITDDDEVYSSLLELFIRVIDVENVVVHVVLLMEESRSLERNIPF
jgi:hypothetical protein